MTFTIPLWALWTLGVVVLGPIIIFMLMCSYIGFLFIAQDVQILKRWFK